MALTGLDWHLFNWRQLEFHGRLCFMKAGLVFADMLSTVSPTYAREIQTHRYGNGLEGLLRHRQADLRGIVNGIDTEAWTPLHEPMLAERYDAATVVAGKARCKAWLQEHAGLERAARRAAVRADRPARPPEGVGPAGRGRRPAPGPGRAARRAGHRASQVSCAARGPGPPSSGSFSAFLGFNDELAHQIEAGADVFLMPSLFEPCGLNQLYSLAHGTVPIVRATGGLADTVVDASPRTLADGTATGFCFSDPTALGALADDRAGAGALARP